MLQTFNALCTPAKLYLSIAVITIISTIVYNLSVNAPQNVFCLGNIKCPVGNKFSFYVMNILFMIIWTYILNFICTNGYPNFAWFLFLLPFLMFIGLVFFVFYIMSFFK